MFAKQLRLYRMFVILAVLFTVMGLALPQPVQAAATPTFVIAAVKPDESVTIRTYSFPSNQLFTVRMDVVGNAAKDGIIVTQTNSGAGGTFEETYRIPAELRGKQQIAVRLESSSGVFAYNWFNNVAQGSTPVTPIPTASVNPIPVTGGINIKIAGVDANKTVTIDANNFPAHVDFKVRIGPFYNFWRGSEVVGTINSGKGGNFRFTLGLPEVVYDVNLVSVRMDSVTGGYYAYNVFKNVDTAIVTPSQPGIPVTGSCEITAVAPAASIVKNGEFDAKWTVKNTGSSNWDMNQVDYRHMGGTAMYKYDSRYDLSQTVKPGQSITVIVDMVAPRYSGYYSTTWGLVRGSTTLCSLPLTIYVQ